MKRNPFFILLAALVLNLAGTNAGDKALHYKPEQLEQILLNLLFSESGVGVISPENDTYGIRNYVRDVINTPFFEDYHNFFINIPKRNNNQIDEVAFRIIFSDYIDSIRFHVLKIENFINRDYIIELPQNILKEFLKNPGSLNYQDKGYFDSTRYNWVYQGTINQVITKDIFNNRIYFGSRGDSITYPDDSTFSDGGVVFIHSIDYRDNTCYCKARIVFEYIDGMPKQDENKLLIVEIRLNYIDGYKEITPGIDPFRCSNIISIGRFNIFISDIAELFDYLVDNLNGYDFKKLNFYYEKNNLKKFNDYQSSLQSSDTCYNGKDNLRIKLLNFIIMLLIPESVKDFEQNRKILQYVVMENQLPPISEPICLFINPEDTLMNIKSFDIAIAPYQDSGTNNIEAKLYKFQNEERYLYSVLNPNSVIESLPGSMSFDEFGKHKKYRISLPENLPKGIYEIYIRHILRRRQCIVKKILIMGD